MQELAPLTKEISDALENKELPVDRHALEAQRTQLRSFLAQPQALPAGAQTPNMVTRK